MAITANLYGPTNRNPDYWRGEFQYLHLIGDGTEVMVPAGGGFLGDVDVGVAGTLAKFYDTPSGGTTDGTTQIATVDTSVTGFRARLRVAFSRGLTVITTGSNGDLTISFRGRQIANTLSFGR